MPAKALISGVLDFLLPRRCCVCGIVIDVDGALPFSYFCRDCHERLRDGAPGRCLRCSSPLGPADAHVDTCLSCRTTKLSFRRSWAVADYDGLLRDLILALKFARRSELAPALSSLLHDALPAHAVPPWDAIVPVPPRRRAFLARGFSPVDLIAQHLAHSLRLPAWKALRFRWPVRPQVGLSRSARFRNVKDAFLVTTPRVAHGRRLLLLDDVMTTGATASACARALRRAGAASVEVAVVAKANHFAGA
ncbi:MAG: phosphoribosyltransferase family protein [Planctomycetota bacterium]